MRNLVFRVRPSPPRMFPMTRAVSGPTWELVILGRTRALNLVQRTQSVVCGEEEHDSQRDSQAAANQEKSNRS